MHLFLTGKPACGKTSLIKLLIKNIQKKRGFFTEEVKNGDERVGFKIITLAKKEAIFAHKDFKSTHKVSRYGVDINIFNSLAIKEMEEALETDCDFVIIDELGKMELFSEEFKEVCLKLLGTKRVLGTISLMGDTFLDKIRARSDVFILNLERENFNETKRKAELALESLSVAKIRELEASAKKIGLEERILIENASSSLFATIENLDLGRRVCVIAGRGNNGADSLACARKLSSHGYNVKAVILKEKACGQEVIFQKEILEKIDIPVYFIEKQNIKELNVVLKDNDFILDGILGIGAKGEVSSFLKEAISLINNSGKKVIACDIPSGLSPDEGTILGAAIRADYTVTFIAPKYGFFLNAGRDICGTILVADVGISRKMLEKIR
jgi:hydroxyethylthiazole kinase-like uncharacterized protein yjeF